MSPAEIVLKKEEIVARYGPWSAYNIQLADQVFTIGPDAEDQGARPRRILQIISDLTREPWENLRVLDLACLEGVFGIEMARHGARVVATEGREANIEKARFVKDVFGLENLELVQDDVRHLSRDRYGDFDVTLCLGILYHLDAPDVFDFLERVAEVTQRIAVIDTHIALTDEERHNHNGFTYWGKPYREHSEESTLEERAKTVWSSLDNPRSFWFNRPSLLNFLTQVGFTSVYECQTPPLGAPWPDRVTLIACKGQRQSLRSYRTSEGIANDLLPERQVVNPSAPNSSGASRRGIDRLRAAARSITPRRKT